MLNKSKANEKFFYIKKITFIRREKVYAFTFIHGVKV